MINEVKRFVLWLIENDIAFTNIADAVKTFRKEEKEEITTEYYPFLDTDGTTAQKSTKFRVLL